MWRYYSLFFGAVIALTTTSTAEEPAFAPGKRVLLDAHNCYPYHYFWKNRLERALSTPPPLGIELDLGWYVDPAGGPSRVVIAHSAPYQGTEPGLREYFFEPIRPIMEKALTGGNSGQWPLITLNINDLRTDSPAFYEALREEIRPYSKWLCTAEKRETIEEVQPIRTGPLLILTNGGEAVTDYFYRQLAVGDPLWLFGASSTGKADNFHRWINYSWSDVEKEGQEKADEWTPEEAARLKQLVDTAHQGGCWIRFYTLNGHPPLFTALQGWGPGYNFGSAKAARIRWQAARDAGVDFIATDQYEEFADFRKHTR